MKVFSMTPGTNEAGEKTLDVNVYGVIAQGWADTVDAAVIAKQLSEHRDAKAITVHINSIGGDAFDGIAIHNLLRGHGAPVTSIVEGMAASAASIIAMTGRTVMGSGAMMMIHNPWTVAMGDAKELRRVAADLDKSRESLVAIYKAKTGKEATELRAMLDAETLMTAEQAKRNGFADEIATDAETTVEASEDAVIFNSIAFPRDRLPIGVQNMAKPPQGGAKATPQAPLKSAPKAQNADETAPEPPPATPEGDKPSDAPAPEAPPVEPAPAPEPTPETPAAAMTPESVRAAVDKARAEGRAEGVREERARIAAIDELPVRGHGELIKAAKYGEQPMSAEQLAVAMLRAEGEAGSAYLYARRSESAAAAGVRPSAPNQASAERNQQIVQAMVQGGDSRRGGVR